MLQFPALDPVAFAVGPLDVRWYALAYIAAFVIGHWLFLRLCDKHPAPNLTRDAADSLFVWVVIGVVAGGRLGYVLFYNLPYFIEHPLEIFMTWQGGMSFHGGLLGVTLAGLWFCRRHNINPLDLGDRLAIVVPIGLFFGRMANFINAELFGTPTSLPWGMVFPTDPLQLPRHPSQLYEAGLEGLALLAILLAVVLLRGIRRGEITGIFLVGYAIARFSVEFVRHQGDATMYLEQLTPLTSGQLLCVPMFIIGLLLLWRAQKHHVT